MQEGRQQQEPTEATPGWRQATSERRRNPRPSGRGGCQGELYVVDIGGGLYQLSPAAAGAAGAADAMPPVGSLKADPEGLTLIREWISGVETEACLDAGFGGPN